MRGWNHVSTSTLAAVACCGSMSRSKTRSGASRRGSMLALSSADSIRPSCSLVLTAARRTGGRVSVSRGPAAQCSFPQGNGRRRRAAGQGQTSRNRSRAMLIRSEAMGPSHSTTRRALWPAPTPFQRGCLAIRTRSAPRNGSRRTSRLTPGTRNRSDVSFLQVLAGRRDGRAERRWAHCRTADRTCQSRGAAIGPAAPSGLAVPVLARL